MRTKTELMFTRPETKIVDGYGLAGVGLAPTSLMVIVNVLWEIKPEMKNEK